MSKKFLIISLSILFGMLGILIFIGVRSYMSDQRAMVGEDYTAAYNIKDNKITIKLDGSATKNLSWEVEIGDPEMVSVAVKKKERGGKATYVISPLSFFLTATETISGSPIKWLW